MANDVKNVAVIGCGVAGLGAAWLASRDPSVRITLYEARSKLGGHANTVTVRTPPRHPRGLTRVRPSAGVLLRTGEAGAPGNSASLTHACSPLCR